MTLLMTAYLIIDAGGTFLKSGVLGQSGNVFEDSIFSIPSYSEGSKDQILRAFEKTMSNGINYMEKKYGTARNRYCLSGAFRYCSCHPFDAA